MANSPRDRRNRKGCFIILMILGLFFIAYVAISFGSKPTNRADTNIQTLPAPPR